MGQKIVVTFPLVVCLAGVLHCGRRHETPAPAPPPVIVVAPAPENPARALSALPSRVSSSSLCLARAGERLLAIVADEDARALHAIALDPAGVTKLVVSVTLPAAPGHVIVHGDKLAVALRDTREVRTVTLRGNEDLALTLDDAPIVAPFDPLALASDGTHLTIVSASSAILQRDGVSTALPRDPRAFVLDADGTARIAHATGSTLTTVSAAGARSDLSLDLPSVCTVDMGMECMTTLHPPAIQSYAIARYGDSVLLPSVSSLTDGPFPQTSMPKPGADLFDSAPSSGGYGGGNIDNPITFRVDAITATGATSVFGKGTREGVHECTLPRGMAVDEASHQLWIACMGEGQVVRHEIRETKKGRSFKPQKDRLDLPFVQAVAYDASSSRLIAFSPFERSVVVAHGTETAKIALPALEREAAWAAGRRLFFSTDKRISAGKKACASCHPDGGDDGLAWDTPQGKRRTLALAGRLGDGKFGWQGKHATLEVHVDKTIHENLRGKGLSSDELAQLVTYVRAMKAPASRPLDGDAARGQRVFAGAADCSSCHDPARNFSDGLVHDVGGGPFRTPSLLGIAGRGRLFHDGRYRSLDELLSGSNGRMGQTASLSAEDRTALQSYLATL